MTDRSVSLNRLLELIAAYGASLSAWPEAERAAVAASLSTASQSVKERLAEARALDDMLTGLPVPEPDPALLGRICASAPDINTRQVFASRRSGRGRIRLNIGAALATLGLGLVAGYAAASERAAALYMIDGSAEQEVWALEQDLPSWLIDEGGAP